MPDETLQVAFEIKSACDEISRKLLRWHWEHKAGGHSFSALLDHMLQRQQESPEYYERMPDLSGKTSWNQLDTTLCMRVLLDPEKDAAKPLDLLGNTERPSAARRACNAIRTARNEAAHATDRTDSAQAAILFNEAVESLEEGYAGTALKTSELEQYYRLAEDFLSRCGGKKPLAASRGAAEEETAPRRSSKKAQGGENSRSQSRSSTGGSRTTSGNTRGTTKRSSGTTRKTMGSSRAKAKKRQRQKRMSRTAVVVLLAALVLGLLVRAYTMGIFKG